MKNVFSAALIAALIMPAMQGCKKGAEDPGISFKARDKKVRGTWNLTAQESTDTDTRIDNHLETPAYTDKTETITTTNYDGTTETEVEKVTDIDGTPAPGTTVVTTETTITAKSIELTLEKDGTYSMTTTEAPKSINLVTSPANICPNPLGGATPGITCDGTYSYASESSTITSTGRWWWEDSKKNKTHLVLDDDYGSMYLLRLSNKEMITEIVLETNQYYTTSTGYTYPYFIGNRTDNNSFYQKSTWTKKD